MLTEQELSLLDVPSLSFEEILELDASKKGTKKVLTERSKIDDQEGKLCADYLDRYC